MRVKVAGLHGWTEVELRWYDARQEFTGLPPGKTCVYGYRHIPDYPNDLNAMHEAEELIPKTPFDRDGLSPRGRFELNLTQILREENYHSPRPMWHATADQHARAFVKTMESTPTPKEKE